MHQHVPFHHRFSHGCGHLETPVQTYWLIKHVTQVELVGVSSGSLAAAGGLDFTKVGVVDLKKDET